MRNGGHLLITLVMLGLAACARPTPGPGGAGTPTAPPSPSPSPEATPTVPAAAAPPVTPDPQRILLPRPEDWSKGAPDARVTFIEWADFQ